MSSLLFIALHCLFIASSEVHHLSTQHDTAVQSVRFPQFHSVPLHKLSGRHHPYLLQALCHGSLVDPANDVFTSPLQNGLFDGHDSNPPLPISSSTNGISQWGAPGQQTYNRLWSPCQAVTAAPTLRHPTRGWLAIPPQVQGVQH